LADQSTRMILDALSRAVAEPAGLPLFAGKATAGLFPATAKARQAARRCQDDGLIRVDAASRDVSTITDKGLSWLLAQSSPRQVLEDFVRVLEEKQAQAVELIDAARRMAGSLESLRHAVERLGPLQPHHLAPAASARRTLGEDILTRLERWHAVSSGDCPLPELFHRVAPAHPGLTVGQFHDALRALHAENRVYLHPWTGPLYDLPEPPYALMTGHEIAYYASKRKIEGRSG
jgi:hypothetical protein